MTTRMRMICGAVGGALFITSSFAQALLREGFELRKHHLSTLSLGEYGWIQIATFVVAGLLVIAFATGLRRVMQSGRGRLMVPVLLGVYGVGMILGGVFTDDPAFGFPAGTPEGPPVTMSWHGLLHAVGAVTAFASLIAASLLFAWRCFDDGHTRWAIYSAASGLIAGVLVFTMDPTAADSSVRLVAASLVIEGWISAIAVHYLRRL